MPFRTSSQGTEPRSERAAATIRAEQPGLIVYATSADWRGRNTDPIEEGITLRERQEIIHLPDLSSVVAKIAVPEAVVERVKPGQGAVVTVDALPDVPFRVIWHP